MPGGTAMASLSKPASVKGVNQVVPPPHVDQQLNADVAVSQAGTISQRIDTSLFTADAGNPDIMIGLLRPEDLLNLTVRGYNLRLVVSDRKAPVLTHIDPKAPAYLSIELPPQSIGEEAFFEVQPAGAPKLKVPDRDAKTSAGDKLPFGARPAQAAMSGPSRLVFR